MQVPVKKAPQVKPDTIFQDLPNDIIIEIARQNINPKAKNLQEAYKDALNLFATNKYFNNEIKPKFLKAENITDLFTILDLSKLEDICEKALSFLALNEFYSNRAQYSDQPLHLAVYLISKISSRTFNQGLDSERKKVIKFVDDAFDLIKKLSKSKNAYIKQKLDYLLYGNENNKIYGNGNSDLFRNSLLNVALSNPYSNTYEILEKILDLGIDVNFKRLTDGARALDIAILKDKRDAIIERIASKTDPAYIADLCKKKKENNIYGYFKKFDEYNDEPNNYQQLFLQSIVDKALKVICK